MRKNNIVFMVLLSVLLLSSIALADKQVTFDFKNSQGQSVPNVYTKMYTCTDGNCYIPSPISPYFDGSSGNTLTTTLKSGWSAVYFFADGYRPRSAMAWTASTVPATIQITFDKASNCHAVVDNLNVPYEVENNKPVTIDVPVSALCDVQSPFYVVNQAPYYMPVQNNEADPLFNHLAADTRVTLQLVDPNGNVVLSQIKDTKIFASTQKTVSFSFTSPSVAAKYRLRIVTDVTDNQCSSASQDETNKDLIVVNSVPDCYTLANNLQVSVPYPIVNTPFDVGLHVYGHVEGSSGDNVDIQLRVTKTDTGALVYTETKSIPADVAQDVSFRWTPTEVDNYDINVYTSINKPGICLNNNFENVNIVGFYVKPVPTYKVDFHVKDLDSVPLDGAKVDVLNLGTNVVSTVYTNSNGDATITGLYEGDYRFTASKDGYQSFVTNAMHIAIDSNVNMWLQKIQPPKYSLTVNVQNGLTNTVLSGASVSIAGPESRSGSTDGNGNIVFGALQAGSYNLHVTSAGFENYDDMVFVGADTQKNVLLQDINDAPYFDAISDQTVNEMQTLTFQVLAHDVDELNGLTYSAVGMPEGSTFNSATRTFSFTPGHDFADPMTGYSRVSAEFKVTDSRGASATVTANIRVNNVLRTFGLSPSCAANVQINDAQTCSIAVIDTYNNNAVPNAQVVFTDGSTSLTQSTDASGRTSFSYTPIGLGAHTAVFTVSKMDFNDGNAQTAYNLIKRSMSDATTFANNLQIGDTQTVNTVIRDASTGAVLSGVNVVLTDGAVSQTKITDASGAVSFSYALTDASAHTISLSASMSNYNDLNKQYSYNSVLRTMTADVVAGDLYSGTSQVVKVTLKDASTGALLSNAQVSYTEGANAFTTNTDANGEAIFTYLISGQAAHNYNIVANLANYNQLTKSGLFNSMLRTMAAVVSCSATLSSGDTQVCTVDVKDASTNAALSAASVALTDGSTSLTQSTDASGRTTFNYVPSTIGAHSISFAMSKTDYNNYNTQFNYDLKLKDITGSVDCLPYVVVDSKQACTVTAIDVKTNTALADASVEFKDNGNSIGTKSTNNVGKVVFEYDVFTNGTHNVLATISKINYATSTAAGTYTGLKHAYDINYMRVYDDSSYSNEKYTFYRGENLYLKFQVVDKNNNNVVPDSDIVTEATLVSLDGGGRARLVRDRYAGGYYYYKLEPIPASHDFIGRSGLYAIAINFNDMSGGEGVQYITILNNAPTNNIPDSIDVTSFDQEFDLSSYISDVEGDVLTITPSVSTDDSSVYTMNLGSNAIINSIIYSQSGKETYKPSDILSNTLATTSYDSGKIDLLTNGNVASTVTKNSMASISASTSINGESNIVYASYLGDVLGNALVSFNPNVVVLAQGNKLIASPKHTGSTRYLVTVEDSDGETSSKVVTFNVASFEPSVTILMTQSRPIILVNRTNLHFSLPMSNSGILGSYASIDNTYDWAVVTPSMNLVTFNTAEFDYVPSSKGLYGVASNSNYCVNNKYCFGMLSAMTFSSNSTIIPPTPVVNDTKIELYIGEVNLPYGTEYHPGDDMALDLKMENSGDINFETIKVIVAVPELHISREIGPFDLKKGKSLTRSIMIPIPEDTDLGEYTLQIDVMNNGVLNRRVGRFIEISS